MLTSQCGANRLEQKVERPGEEPPKELPFARRDRLILGEEVHQGKE
jgi:hypothetical protein